MYHVLHFFGFLSPELRGIPFTFLHIDMDLHIAAYKIKFCTYCRGIPVTLTEEMQYFLPMEGLCQGSLNPCL